MLLVYLRQIDVVLIPYNACCNCCCRSCYWCYDRYQFVVTAVVVFESNAVITVVIAVADATTGFKFLRLQLLFLKVVL